MLTNIEEIYFRIEPEEKVKSVMIGKHIEDCNEETYIFVGHGTSSKQGKRCFSFNSHSFPMTSAFHPFYT